MGQSLNSSFASVCVGIFLLKHIRGARLCIHNGIQVCPVIVRFLCAMEHARTAVGFSSTGVFWGDGGSAG